VTKFLFSIKKIFLVTNPMHKFGWQISVVHVDGQCFFEKEKIYLLEFQIFDCFVE